MDKNKLLEFMNALGVISETALLFYRSALEAKATQAEAMRLTQVFIAAILYGNQNNNPEEK